VGSLLLFDLLHIFSRLFMDKVGSSVAFGLLGDGALVMAGFYFLEHTTPRK